MIAIATEIKSVADLSSFREKWDALISLIPEFSFAQTYVYQEIAAAAALSRGEKVYLITFESEGSIHGLWPVSIRNGFYKELRPLSCGSYEEYGDPLIENAYAIQASAAILETAIGLKSDALRAQAINPSSAFADRLLAAKTLGRGGGSIDGFSTSLSRFKTWEEYAAQTSKTHYKELRRQLRRLQEQGAVEMDWCKRPDEAEVVIRWIWYRKRIWAKSRGVNTEWIWSDEVMRFFIDLARRVDLINVPLVTFLKLDGSPVAAQINLVGGDKLEFFITTFDETFGRFSPGDLLIEHAFRWALKNCLDFDFRILSADYKARRADKTIPYLTADLYLTPRAAKWAPVFGKMQRVRRRMSRAPRKVMSLLKCRHRAG